MSQENVELVKKFIAPPGTDYRALFGDDAAFAAAKQATERPSARAAKVGKAAKASRKRPAARKAAE